MASRRMVSNKIIDSARFIKMPISSQCLYFHLIAKGDDDGVVEAFNVMRMIGATEDDLKVLVAKGFVTVLNEDLVSYINDWKEHNLIRADRKIDSIYKDLLLQVVQDIELLEKKPSYYSRKKQLADICLTNGSIGKDSIVEVSIEEDNIYSPAKAELPTTKKTTNRFKKPSIEEVQEYCNERNNNINAEQFIDYYEANGWKVGKNTMKDWKAAVRTWERRNTSNKPVRKEIVPKWIDKEVEDEYLSDEELAEFEKKLKNPDLEARKAALIERLNTK